MDKATKARAARKGETARACSTCGDDRKRYSRSGGGSLWKCPTCGSKFAQGRVVDGVRPS